MELDWVEIQEKWKFQQLPLCTSLLLSLQTGSKKANAKFVWANHLGTLVIVDTQNLEWHTPTPGEKAVFCPK